VSKGGDGREARLQLHSHVPCLAGELFLRALAPGEGGEGSEERRKVVAGILGGGDARVVAADGRAARRVKGAAVVDGGGVSAVFGHV